MKNISQDRQNPVPPTYRTDCCMVTLVNHNVATLHGQLLTNSSLHNIMLLSETGGRCQMSFVTLCASITVNITE